MMRNCSNPKRKKYNGREKNFIKANIANKIYVANLNTSKQQHHRSSRKKIGK